MPSGEQQDSQRAGDRVQRGKGQADQRNPGNDGEQLARDSLPRLHDERRQIFRPAFPHGGETGVHPDARDARTCCEVQEAGGLGPPRQRDIFENFGTDRRMAADFLVGIAADQQVLAVGRCRRGLRIVHHFVRIKLRQAAINERDQRALPPGVHFLGGRKRDTSGAETPRRRKRHRG